MRLDRIVLLSICSMVFMHSGIAAATFPDNGDVVLYRLSEQEAKLNTAQIQTLRSRQSTQLPDLISYAAELVNLSKQSADPRYYGRAAAIIGRINLALLTKNLRNRAVVIQAEVAQFHHEFDRAIFLLGDVLASDPLQTDAVLLRAQLNYVTGNYAASQSDCKRTLFHLPSVITATCFYMTKGLQKEAQWAINNAMAIKKMLHKTSNKYSGSQSLELVWIYSVLSDVLLAHKLYDEALDFVKQGLREFPESLYLLTTYADILLQQGRAHDLLSNIRIETNHLPLLVRLSIAETRSNTYKQFKYVKKLQGLFEMESRRGSILHLRERAMFELLVQNNLSVASQLAVRNWKKQKEPVDAKLLAHTKYLSNPKNYLTDLTLWITKNQVTSDIDDFLYGDF